MSVSRLLTILGLVTLGVLSRLLPHPPNFTSMNAIALFSIFYLGNRWLSFATVSLAIFLSDLIYGFHSTLPYVYLSFGLIVLMSYQCRNVMSLKNVPLICLAATFLFFMVTNFGIWMTGSLYPKTISGLGVCYFAALPFLANQILSDCLYSALLYSHLYRLKQKLPAKKFAYLDV